MAVVNAYWNEATFLENQKDYSLEVLHGRHGRPDDYWNGKVLARLWDCEITRKWIRDLTIFGDEEDAVLIVNFQIQCNFALFSGEERRERT